MTHHRKKAGIPRKVPGQKCVASSFESREVEKTLYTNAPHRKRVLTRMALPAATCLRKTGRYKRETSLC